MAKVFLHLHANCLFISDNFIQKELPINEIKQIDCIFLNNNLSTSFIAAQYQVQSTPHCV